jgi:dihydropteroate synthase
MFGHIGAWVNRAYGSLGNEVREFFDGSITMTAKQRESIHFVTGRLAEPAVREIVQRLAQQHSFAYSIDVLPITVAALMTPKWLMRHMSVPSNTTRILLPGYLAPHIEEIRHAIGQQGLTTLVDCGPKDVWDLPTMFGSRRYRSDDYGQTQIEIIAEINYAPRLQRKTLIAEAQRLVQHGADRIDLGCEPGIRWSDAADAVRAITDLGIAVSIDSFDPWEVHQAVSSGATLVLSVNSENRQRALDWGVEVVAIPDDPADYQNSMVETANYLLEHKVPFRLDPILEPIGCGFARSLGRYLHTREMFPDAAMMMGIGNITELTDADSAPINTLLLGFCAELQIHSVLTTQVIAWAQSSVQECDLARRLVEYAVRHQVPPKHLEERLVMLRDTTCIHPSPSTLRALAEQIKDNNYRVAIDGEKIHLMSAGVHLQGTDPFEMMQELFKLPESRNVDPSHAFYLGFELSKALTALTLNKRYEQDEALRWGLHTRPEQHHRLARKRAKEDLG